MILESLPMYEDKVTVTWKRGFYINQIYLANKIGDLFCKQIYLRILLQWIVTKALLSNNECSKLSKKLYSSSHISFYCLKCWLWKFTSMLILKIHFNACVVHSRQMMFKVWNKNTRLTCKMSLTHFMPLVFFYTSWKHQKNIGFLMFLGGIERD